MRKAGILLLLLFSIATHAQNWQAEIAVGGTGYKGDMTEQVIPFRTILPAAAVHLKYNTGGLFTFRAGIGYSSVRGKDSYNNDPIISDRNLDFRSSILEFHLATELNLMDPDFYYSYPYLLGGVGVFRFNPYSRDQNGNKTFLKPLSTEGQGLADYPDRKEYSLTQLCIPIGLGWKHRLNDRFEIGAEIGIRALFTDYLDDLSNSYIDPDKLRASKGDIAVELAYRASTGQMVDGAVRGNPENKDIYFFSGLKLAIDLKKKKKAPKETPVIGQ